jgi:hypothetical protein
METATVRYLVAGTVVEETWTADRILTQQFADGRANLTLLRGGRVAEHVTYRRAERIHRTVTAEHLELP